MARPSVQLGARDRAIPGPQARGRWDFSRVPVHSPGRELPPGTRSAMEPSFGHDFSAVRIHTDGAAAEGAARLGARAVTSGRDIVFGHDQFRPDTTAGRRLIAHELAHVVQNGGRRAEASRERVEPAAGRAEAESHRAGVLAGLGLPAGRIGARITGLALTRTSDQVLPLISYSATDWVVTTAEERQALALLTADTNLSATIVDLQAAGMLRALLERVDEPANRRDLLRLLGVKLDARARALVEPIIQDLDVNAGGIWGSQIQYGLGRLGVSGPGAAFNRASYQDLVSKDEMAAFTGSGATGVNPSERGYTDWMQAGTRMFDPHINPVDDLSAYLTSLTPDQRRRQVELLVRQPISTNFAASYAGQLPSRLQVIRAAAAAQRLEPELVTAIILAEQRDQSAVEDARDFIGALVFARNTSIGLGQVTGSTARRHDLFADMLTNQPSQSAAVTSRGSVDQPQMAWLLSSDEVSIAAVARYIRVLADQGARQSIAALPNTKRVFPGIDLAAYANPSSAWPEDNIGALGMYYTSRAWTDDTRSAGWGWFVQQAYRDVKSARVF